MLRKSKKGDFQKSPTLNNSADRQDISEGCKPQKRVCVTYFEKLDEMTILKQRFDI